MHGDGATINSSNKAIASVGQPVAAPQSYYHHSFFLPLSLSPPPILLLWLYWNVANHREEVQSVNVCKNLHKASSTGGLWNNNVCLELIYKKNILISLFNKLQTKTQISEPKNNFFVTFRRSLQFWAYALKTFTFERFKLPN